MAKEKKTAAPAATTKSEQGPEKKAKKEKEQPKQAAAQEKGHMKGPTPRLKERFRNEILPNFIESKEYKNPMAVPRLEKIVLNIGVGEASKNIKVLDFAADELSRITGQKPVIRRAKKAISSFKLREGMPIGVSVTLRGNQMYEFLDRLVSIALPRVRDFKGLSPDAFDGRGNYTFGLKDQLIFPEIDYAKVDKSRGMNITLVTTARTDDEARKLLLHLGMPFRRN